MTTEIKKTISWGHTLELEGAKISASSANFPTVYVTPRADHSRNMCFSINYEELKVLYAVIGEALKELENLEKSPP